MQATTLSDRAVLLDLTFGAPSVTRKMDREKVDTDADKNLLRLSKDVLDSPEVQAVYKADGAIRQWLRDPVRGQGFGRLCGRGGMYLIPLASFAEVDARLTDYIERERAGLLLEVEATYDARVATSKLRLRSEAKDVVYPKLRDFMGSFYTRVRYLTFGVPGNLPDAIQVREKARLDELWREAEAEIRAALREAFADLVEHAVERLTDGPRGKKQRFEAGAMLEKWDGFLATFTRKDLTGDADLAALVEQARGLLAGVDPEELRDYRGLRKRIAAGFTMVKAALEPLVKETSGRRMRVGEE